MWAPTPLRVRMTSGSRGCALRGPRRLSILSDVSRFDRSLHGSPPLLPSLRPCRFPLSSCRPRSRNIATASGRRHRFRFPLVPLLPSLLYVGGAGATEHARSSPSVLYLARFLSLYLFSFIYFFLVAPSLTPCCTIHS
jgi:hypothetical protein